MFRTYKKDANLVKIILVSSCGNIVNEFDDSLLEKGKTWPGISIHG